jgi:NitT/TauT family transport system permease protein
MEMAKKSVNVSEANNMSKEHEIYLNKVKKTKRKILYTRSRILVIFIALWQLAANLMGIDPFRTSCTRRVIV